MSCSAWGATVRLGTAKVVRQALQNMQPTRRGPEIHAHPGLFESLDGGRTRGMPTRRTVLVKESKIVRVAYAKRPDPSRNTFG